MNQPNKQIDGATLALDSLNKRIVSIETNHRSWGGPEALELQMLGMVELRQKMVRPAALTANPRETRRAYVMFVSMVNGADINLPLFCVLREAGMLDQLPRLLGDFARCAAVEYPPEWSPT